VSKASQASRWVDTVAVRAGATADEVTAILREWRIDPSASYPAPRHLHLTHIRFSGTRPEAGTPNPGPFEFNWDGLGPGIWALASEINNAGKTSVLEIAMWALRGDPKNLAADVRKWLENVDVGFELNGTPHRVTYAVDDGRPSGELKRSTGSGTDTTVFTFETADEFEEHMGSFMVAELGLHTLRSWNSTTEEPTEHGWNALTGALYITRKQSSSLLGDLVMGGLAGRLLQVFLGVPWTQTVFNARAARDTANARRTRARSKGADPARRKALADQLSALQRERDEASTATSSLVSDTASAFAQMTAANHTYSDAQDLVRRLTSELAVAKLAVREFKQELIDRSETALAERFFQGLNPSLCPRCDTHIDEQRRRKENTHHECSVCQTHVDLSITATTEEDGDEVDDDPLSVSELQAQLGGAEVAVASAQIALDGALAARDRARAAATAARAEVEEAEAGRGALAKLQELDVRIARVEGAVEEVDSVAQVDTDTIASADAAHNILSAAHSEADERLRDARGDLFDDLNRLATEIGQQLGIATLTGVEIDGAAHVKVYKGGTKTSFSNCSPGEQLRLRVAVVVAMLRVGQDRGVGRHPGLLIIDSPAAEETNDNDAGVIMDNLHQITEIVPGLQVIAATARPSLLDGVVPAHHIRQVTGASQLW
jgi:hypothetical protein